MTAIRFQPLPAADVNALRAGMSDANGQTPERRIAHEAGYPCRCCMKDIQVGESYLTLAYRPFPAPQPYAEIGPIFLHADDCRPGGGDGAIPAFLDSSTYIVRGYGPDDRIVYGTGAVTATVEIPNAAARLLADDRVAYVHVRSASNNCYHCRIERA